MNSVIRNSVNINSVNRANREKGVALLSVVLVVAVMAIALTLLGERLQVDARRQSNIKIFQQAWWYADSAEQIVVQGIKELNRERTTHLGQSWAKQAQIYPVDGGTVGGSLSDMRSCLNINGLLSGTKPGTIDAGMLKQFQFLLTNLRLEDTDPDALLSRIQDWMDGDFDETGFNGAEDLQYLRDNREFYTANSTIASLDELLLTGAISRTNLDLLATQVCVLPDKSQKININTLSLDKAPLLAAMLFNRITVDEARELIENRAERGYSDTAVFLNAPDLKKLALTATEKKSLKKQLTVKSDAFKAQITVQFHGLKVTLSSLYLVDGKRVYRVQRIYGEA